MTQTNHLSVCICSFKRPELLKRLLLELNNQETEGLFSYSIVVADNDRLESAKQVVSAFARASSIPVIYCVEPEQNIAMARNKALENANGDFIVFIDDDEIPTTDWLRNLFKTLNNYQAAGVLGPVKPRFEHNPPSWVIKGKFFERPEYVTGHKLDWTETRTGNVLFRRSILNGVNSVFNPEFGTGSEDVDFFRRMTEKGCIFVWCNEAIVFETVPPSRCRSSYFLRRALLRGSTFPKRRTGRVHNFLKSVIAVPSYLLLLPLVALSGQHMFIKYLIKLVDHSSRILAFLGCNLAKDRGI